MLRAEAEEPHHAPQQVGLRLEDLVHRLVGDRHDRRRFERPRVGRAAEAVEERHLAEEVATLHEGEHGLAPVIGAAGQRDPAVVHHVEVVGVGTLLEDHVAASQLHDPGRGEHPVERVIVEPGEQLRGSDELLVHHGRDTSDGIHGR
jgi:hypothetical protein